MARYGAAGGFSAGLQGGMDAGARLNANSLAARDSKVKNALAMRGLQLEEAKLQSDEKTKGQKKYLDALNDIYAVSQTGVVAGGAVREKTLADLREFMSPRNLGGPVPGPSPLQTYAMKAGVPVEAMELKFRSLMSAPTIEETNRSQALGTRSGTLQADLAEAPRVAAAAADQAQQVAGATVTGRVEAETANRGVIAANAGATAEAEAAARERTATPDIVKLQREREKALARGDTRAAEEIGARITSLGASQTYDPRAGSQLSATEIRKAAQGVVTVVQSMNEVLNMQEMFSNTPQAAGAIGAAFEFTSGFLGQLGSLVGADLSLPGDADVTAARTQARLVVRSIAQGLEKSDKISNQDRQNAAEIARALEKDASAQQVYSAAKTSLDILSRELGGAADQLLAGDDVVSAEGVEAASKKLTANGVPRAQHARIIAAVRARRR